MLKQVLEQPAVFWHEPRAPRGVWTIALVPSQHSLPHWPPVSKTACWQYGLAEQWPKHSA